MTAEPYYQFKRLYENGDIIEVKVWSVSVSADKPHGFKYSLAFVRGGKRIIGYDNAERKGDHRHYGERVYQYTFKDIDKLLEDFFEDVRRVRNES